jgi:O-antigen/teichoic acid export membrane protein
LRERASYLGRADTALGAKSALAVLTKLAPGIATLTTNLIIGRLGGAALLGLTQTVISTAALTSLAYPGPAAAAASRYLSASIAAGDSDRASAIATYLGRRVIFAVACLVGLLLGGSILVGFDNPTMVIVSCVMVAGISLRVFVEGLHFGGGKGRRMALWSISVAAIGIGGSSLMLLLGNRSAWVVAPVAVANVVFAILTWPPSGSVNLEKPQRRIIRQFILLAACGTLASAGFVQLTTIVANLFAGVSFAGQYAAALTMTTPLAILATAISATLFPALSAMQVGPDDDSVRKRVSDVTSILTLCIGAAVSAMIVMAAPLTYFVWGKQYIDTWWILLFLLVGTLATTIAVPSVTALTSSSNRGMVISCGSSFVGAICGLAAWLILIPIAPRVGVIVGCALATTLTAVVPFVIVWRQHRMRWARSTSEIFAIVGISLTLALLERYGAIEGVLTPALAATVVCLWGLIRFRDIRRLRSVLRSMTRRKSSDHG